MRKAHCCNFGRLLEAYCPLPSSVRGDKARRCGLGQGTGAAAPGGGRVGNGEPEQSSPSVGSTERDDIEFEVVDCTSDSPCSQSEAIVVDDDEEEEMDSCSTMKELSPRKEGVGNSNSSRGVLGEIGDGQPGKGEEEEEEEDDEMMNNGSGSTVRELSTAGKGTPTSKSRGGGEDGEGEPDERATKRRRLADTDSGHGVCRRLEGVSAIEVCIRDNCWSVVVVVRRPKLGCFKETWRFFPSSMFWLAMLSTPCY